MEFLFRIQLPGAKRPVPVSAFDEDEAAPFKKADEAFAVYETILFTHKHASNPPLIDYHCLIVHAICTIIDR